MNPSPPNPTPFQYGWWSFDLGEYRPCDGTYCFYEYGSLPPIPEAQFTGKLEWLGPLKQDIDAAILYRFWMENVLWFSVNDGEGTLTKDQQRYLAHYQSAQSSQ